MKSKHVCQSGRLFSRLDGYIYFNENPTRTGSIIRNHRIQMPDSQHQQTCFGDIILPNTQWSNWLTFNIETLPKSTE
jgi:hypothetical protein